MKSNRLIGILLISILMIGCRKKKGERYVLEPDVPKIPLVFEPFQHVSTLVPGISTLHEADSLLGKRKSANFYRGEKGDTTKMITVYQSGISIISETFHQVDSLNIIDAIVVEPPYDGISSDSIVLGMKKSKAITLLEKRFQLVIGTEGVRSFRIYALGKSKEHFQVYFEEEELVSFKLYKGQ